MRKLETKLMDVMVLLATALFLGVLCFGCGEAKAQKDDCPLMCGLSEHKVFISMPEDKEMTLCLCFDGEAFVTTVTAGECGEKCYEHGGAEFFAHLKGVCGCK